jgi:hypothetical protein
LKIVIFQPFQKVWTPRTPDSNYDSLGSAPLKRIVFLPLIAEGIGTRVVLQPGLYEPALLWRGAGEGSGYGIKLLSGSYTPAA